MYGLNTVQSFRSLSQKTYIVRAIKESQIESLIRASGFQFISQCDENQLNLDTFDQLLSQLDDGELTSVPISQYRVQQNAQYNFFLKNFSVLLRKALIHNTPDLTVISYGYRNNLLKYLLSFHKKSS